MELKDCFKFGFPDVVGSDFTGWLLKSNNPKVGPYLAEGRFNDMLAKVESESLQEILDILLREPQADYFWYNWSEHGGKLTYTLPHHDVVAAGSLRVDKEKMKIFLRDYKLEKLLQ